MTDDDIKRVRELSEKARCNYSTTLAEYVDALLAERERLVDVLYSNGFVRCDISACNCGSWHARYGLRERFEELKDALSESTDLNGKTVLSALNEVIAERDALRTEVESLRKDLAGLESVRREQADGRDYWVKECAVPVVSGPRKARK